MISSQVTNIPLQDIISSQITIITLQDILSSQSPWHNVTWCRSFHRGKGPFGLSWALLNLSVFVIIAYRVLLISCTHFLTVLDMHTIAYCALSLWLLNSIHASAYPCTLCIFRTTPQRGPCTVVHLHTIHRLTTLSSVRAPAYYAPSTEAYLMRIP